MKKLAISTLLVLATTTIVLGPRSAPDAAAGPRVDATRGHMAMPPSAERGAQRALARGWRQLMSSGAVTCGSWRWAVKTLSDKRAGGVAYAPRTQSIGFLRGLSRPSGLTGSTLRVKGSAEYRTYRLGKVRLLRAAMENDRDIHLVVAPASALKKTMIVEFPSVACKGAAGSKKKTAIAAARQHLLADCGDLGSSFVKLKGTATITGVGFFDATHGQSGVAPNGIELHPALSYANGSCSKDTGSTGGGGGGGDQDCTPGYSPCLVDHNGADYDCYGGGGNGPYYTKSGVVYTVTGSDPYGLDSDDDGKACE